MRFFKSEISVFWLSQNYHMHLAVLCYLRCLGIFLRCCHYCPSAVATASLRVETRGLLEGLGKPWRILVCCWGRS